MLALFWIFVGTLFASSVGVIALTITDAVKVRKEETTRTRMI